MAFASVVLLCWGNVTNTEASTDGSQVKIPDNNSSQVSVLRSGPFENSIVGSMDCKCCNFFVFKDKGISSFCVDVVIAKLYFGTILTGVSPHFFLLCIRLQKRRMV